MHVTPDSAPGSSPPGAPPTPPWPTQPWPEQPWPEAPPPSAHRGPSRGRRWLVTVLAVLAFAVAPAITGYEVGRDQGGSTSTDATSSLGTEGPSRLPSDGISTIPAGGAADSGAGATTPVDVAAVVAAVDDVVVNINTTVEGGGQAAGTGIVISGSGLVLTNNHVIAGSTGMTVELAATGQTRSARVLGYSVVDDVALLQVQNVSGLTAATLGSSRSLAIGESLVALGNAGGRGGTPTVVSGRVTALDQEITASDSDGTNAQTIDGLIELAANIQPGDSGGPVVRGDGTVVGMTVAASASNSFGFLGGTGGEGYAIAIEDAVAIAKKILSGEGGPDIRVGATRGVLGVQIQPQLTNRRVPGGSGAGAQVVGVEPGSGADKAGLVEGSFIVGIAGKTVSTTNDLTSVLVPYGPGEVVELVWREPSGTTRQATVRLGEGPPA